MTAGCAACTVEETRAPGSTRASSFYAAMRIMPPRQRSAMYEIYHYCRVIDDIADEDLKPEERLRQLGEWRDYIARIYAGNPPPSLHGLAQAVANFALRKEDLLAVIDGVEMDVHGPILAPDFATLTLYCDRVACAVGRLSVRVFGLEEEDGLALAHHLGLALQLTNILRDIDEDAAIGRVYLPKELLQKTGLSTENPLQTIQEPAISAACNALAEKALEHFREADIIMKRYERKRIRTPRIMSHAYHSILKALTERGFTSPREPIRLSKIRLGFILARNILF